MYKMLKEVVWKN